MKKHVPVIVLSLLLMYSCKNQQKATTNTPVSGDVVTSAHFRKPITDKELFKTTTEMVPLDTVYISKDTLNIFTKKIWGCEPDNFKLVWNGGIDTTAQHKTTVKLLQYVASECKEKHRFHLTYNISPIKLKTDTAAVRTTNIYVGGWHRMVTYVDSTATPIKKR